jgi:hypothetical protein
MNHTPSLPIADLAPAGDKMFDWLGKLWTSIFDDAKLVRNWTAAQGLLSAQLYLNFLETLQLPDRTQSPVYHRDRWRMLTIKASERNTGPAVAVRLGSDNIPVVGPQVETPFIPDRMIEIGGHTQIAGLTAYPLTGDIADISTAIVDDIVTPTKVLVSGTDFRIENGTILFFNYNDPFALGFPARTIQTPDGEDTEIALWAADTLVDKDYVFNHLGHVLGLRDVSSEFYSHYLNALWDVYNSGASLALFRSGIAALLDEPAIQEDNEVVQLITTSPRHQVVTDKHVYEIPESATLRAQIIQGAVLQSGELLTETLRIWENLDPQRLAAGGQDPAQLRQDVPALFLPAGFFRASLRHGLGLTWDLEPITYQGMDANNNPRLRFTVYGTDTDIATFWDDFDAYCETHAISGQTCFTEHLHGTLPQVVGAEWGTVAPLQYFLSNFLKANLLIVAVDSNKLSAQGRQTLHLLSNLRNGIPAHTCFFVVERQSVGPDPYDLAEQTEDSAVPMLALSLYETAGTEVYVKTNLRYGDARPRVSWVPTCRRQTDEANT